MKKANASPVRKLIKLPVVVWLRFWARCWLRWNRPLFIAVGGSSGKTSTVLGIVAALSPTQKVRSGGGLNSETGVPLGILGIRMDHYDVRGWYNALVQAPFAALSDKHKCDVYVAEYGIDHPGDMKSLLKTRIPDIAVLTSAGLEHAGYFPQVTVDEVLDAIAEEEMHLLYALPESATAIVPGTDPRITSRLGEVKARVLTVGAKEGATAEVMRYAVTESSTDADIFHKGVTYPVVFKHPVTRAAMTSVTLAATAAHEAGVRFGEALTAIARVGEVPPGRGRVLRGKNKTLLIDSSYNATPEAMTDALALLNDLGGERRRVAILGDMRELGDHAPAAHKSLADAVSDACDVAILIGPNMKKHLAPLISERVSQVVICDDVTTYFHEVDGIIHEGDVVLIKGSQNTLFLERITASLLLDPKDVNQLPRRGARWDEARARAR